MQKAKESATGLGHKYSLLISLIVVLMVGSSVAWYVLQYDSSKSNIRIGGHTLRVNVADDAGERTAGLSGRDNLDGSQGMLFIYEDNTNACIWMKDMKFSIDIVWISADGSVVHMERNVSPETYPNEFCSESAAKYVLELPAGSIDRLGFQTRITELEAVAF